MVGSETGVVPITEVPVTHDWQWPHRAPWGWLALLLLTAATYAVGSGLALLSIERSELSSVFFIPAGIMAGFLLRVRIRRWWAVVLAGGAVEALMDLGAGYSETATAGFVLANVAGPVVGALIVRSRVGRLDLARVRHLGWFVAASVGLGTAVAAAIGSGFAHYSGEGDFGTQFWQWWLGDALGVIVVGSMILVWGSSPDRRSLRSVSGVVLIGGTLFVTVWVLTVTHLPLVFLVLVGVTVAGVVFGPRAVATAALVIAAAKGLHVVFGDAIDVPGLTPVEAIMIIKLRLGVFTLAGLIVAAVAHEREAATRAAAEATTQAVEAEAARRAEHEVAVQLQQGLMPDAPIEHPNLSIATRYTAASEAVSVGGDWYDMTWLPDGRVAIVLGDVGGHGLDAASQMGRLRTAAAALGLYTGSPGEVLSLLDKYAQDRHAVEFATVSYTVLDPATGHLTYASAGHPPMLHLSPTGEATWLDGATSMPLHGGPPQDRADASTVLTAGSLLIGYTDGLVENYERDITVGLERLESTARKLADRPVPEICDILLQHMSADSVPRDDVVLVVLRYEPQPVQREVVITIARES